ncbi:MAG: adaptor protein MecA [Lachnospiraceae bacterium]|nr:adaptor protein MecA [Lachnospiraceae bacterium]
MKIKRISTDTVRCLITKDELEANGLSVSDFMVNDGRCEEFIRKIVALAEQEVNFKVCGGPMSIQVAALPDNTIVLTLSEKQDMNIMDFLNALKSAVTGVAEEQAPHQDPSANKQGSNPYETVEAGEEMLFYAATLDHLIALAFNMSTKDITCNSLYSAGDRGYFLYVECKGADEKRQREIASCCMEFVELVSADRKRILYFIEHEKCLIKDSAFERISAMKTLQIV